MQVFVNNFNKIIEHLVVRNNWRNSGWFSSFISISIKEFNFDNLRIYKCFVVPPVQKPSFHFVSMSDKVIFKGI